MNAIHHDKHAHTPTGQPHGDHSTPRRATLIWLALVAATGLGWLVAERELGGAPIVALLFGLAFAKGSLVILDYMAVRHAPLVWRVLMLGWLGVVCALIGLAYWMGLRQ